jgi:hypothetical protein
LQKLLGTIVAQNAVAAKAFLGSKIQELLDSIHSYNKNILAAIDEEVEEKERSLRRQMVDLDTYGRDTLLRARLLSSIIEDCPPNVVVRNCLAQAPVIDVTFDF